MKTIYKYLLIGAASLSAIVGANAQTTRAGFFLDDFAYRYQNNPAYGNSKNFVSMPGLGNFNFGVQGNIGISNVLYNIDGRTTTFLNPKISAAEALSNIHSNNKIGLDLQETILAAGFKGFNGYNTITISAKANLAFNMPGEIFSLLKNGLSNTTYDISDLRAHGLGYGEVALGHSHQINSKLRIGATLKVLLGVGGGDVNLRNAKLSLGEDAWSVSADGEMNLNVKDIRYVMETNDQGRQYISEIKDAKVGIEGTGFALDLGATYAVDSLQNLVISAAVTDIGFMSWKDNARAIASASFTTDKYTFNVDDEAANSFDNEWEKIKDDFANIYQLQDGGNTGGTTRMLGATINVGVQYKLPMYRKLSFGLLNTTRIQGVFSWTDFRLSANFVPCKFFDMAVTGNVGTFGGGFGWLINLHPTGFNLFLGMDRMVGKLAKQGAPLSSNASFNMGINFPF